MGSDSPQTDRYYSWQTKIMEVRGSQFTVETKPGVAGFSRRDVAAVLLAENIKVGQTDIVVCFHGGDGLVGAVAASAAGQGQVVLTDPRVPSFEACQRSLRANGLVNGRAYLSDCLSHLHLDHPADVVTARLPKGKHRALTCIWDGFKALKPGGRFYLAGANKEGIKTYLRHAGDIFGNVAVLAYRKGHRVGVAMKGDAPAKLPQDSTSEWLTHDRFRELIIQVRGGSYTVCTRPGVFSWDRLDKGTRMLIEALEVGPSDTVLDLGCGYGIVGIVCAELAPQGKVYLADADITALEAARRTVEFNRTKNSEVVASDCCSKVEHLTFDLIATNPPFHQGTATERQVARQFIRDAARLLRPGGRLYLVANRFLPYETEIQQAFGYATTITEDSRYKVLMAARY